MTVPTLTGDGRSNDLAALIAFQKRHPVIWQGREQILDRLPTGRGIRFSVADAKKV